MTSDTYISQVTTNDFRFGTRVAWLAQERCIEFDEEISRAQVLPGPMTICIAKRAFFAASGSPEAPWQESGSDLFFAFDIINVLSTKAKFRQRRISPQISSSLQAHLCRKDRLAKGQRPHKSDRMIESYQKDEKDIKSIYTWLQFVLISWDNQLRFPFWDRTFLLKAKCTAVLQVSHRFIDDRNRYHCQDFWDHVSKTQLCRQCQGHLLYMFSCTVTCLSACSHQFSIMVPVVFEVCFFRVMLYSCFVHLARLKFVAFLEDFSAWFSFSRCFSLLARWVRHWCKDLGQLRSYAWDLTKKKTRSYTWSVHVIKEIRVSWETAKDRCTVLTFEKF